MMRGSFRTIRFLGGRCNRTLTSTYPTQNFRFVHVTRPALKQLSREESGQSVEVSFTEKHRNSRDSENPLSETLDESGLRHFLGNVVKHMGIGLGATAAVVVGSVTFIDPNLLQDLALPFFGIGVIGSIGSAYAIDAMKPR